MSIKQQVVENAVDKYVELTEEQTFEEYRRLILESLETKGLVMYGKFIRLFCTDDKLIGEKFFKGNFKPFIFDESLRDRFLRCFPNCTESVNQLFDYLEHHDLEISVLSHSKSNYNNGLIQVSWDTFFLHV